MDRQRLRRYERIREQLSGLLRDSPGKIAAMATIAALLHAKMPHHFWTGFYVCHPSGELHVGPYQGPLACQVLRDRGVCVECARTKTPLVVRNVEAFPGHVACDSRSKSEVAVPVVDAHDDVIAVFDVDSDQPNRFSHSDIKPLKAILALLEPLIEG